MKKHTEAVTKIDSKDLPQTIATLRKDISELTRGIALGDVQNYKTKRAKKQELARLLTRQQAESKETK